MRKSIDQDSLQALIEAHAVREARVNRVEASWGLSVRLGMSWHPIRSRREATRTWATLTAVGRFCETVGLKVFSVEL